MTTTLDTDWTTYARRLADTLRDNGDLRCPAWHAAVAAVPRHLLVPRAFEQDSTGAWSEFTTADAPQRVYSSETLITALETVGAHQQPMSSSTKPDLMVRMLEILDIQDGHRVLEIGTGTGYNAALLAHRLGDDRVFSVEVDSGLVDLAHRRLAAAGFRPTLVATDGAAGLPEHAPFDRIIATCSVPAIPWAWAGQLADGGAILADLKLAISAGNLVHLHRPPTPCTRSPRRPLHQPVGCVHGDTLRTHTCPPSPSRHRPRRPHQTYNCPRRAVENRVRGLVPGPAPATREHHVHLQP